MSEKNSVVAVFASHDQAEEAVRQLQKDGFDMKKLSIVGKDYHTDEHVVGYYNTGDRMLYWGKLGAIWGGFWGLLFGSAFFWVPGIGQLLVAGPLVVWIVAALEGAAVTGGLTRLGAGLYSIGIPKNSILKYETEVKNGSLLLVAHGSADEVQRARDILRQTEAETTTVHAQRAAVACRLPAVVGACFFGRAGSEFVGNFAAGKERNPMKKLMVFDLDGTLAESKASLDAEMSALLA